MCRCKDCNSISKFQSGFWPFLARVLAEGGIFALKFLISTLSSTVKGILFIDRLHQCDFTIDGIHQKSKSMPWPLRVRIPSSEMQVVHQNQQRHRGRRLQKSAW